MKKYDLRKLITFHSSVAKAARFVDATRRDSLPGVIPHLTRAARPSGKLWTKHISGHTPAGQRATLLKGLGNLPEDTRGILSNCACLGEGVDVPVLDGVAFIDPKRSMVDIIQAVGRVIRKAEGKQVGTIVIPVFIDESKDADHILSQSAFEPVWQVLKALRAHDRRLADELDQLRLSLGQRPKSGGMIRFPDNIHLDVPRLLLHDFEQAFYVRTVEQTTDKPLLSIEQILSWADAHKAAIGEWPKKTTGQVIGADETWLGIDSAAREGRRGLSGRSTLAKLLAEHRSVRNHMDLPPLTIEQILAWMVAHKAATGDWPRKHSGQVAGTDETWARINSALEQEQRGLPVSYSLAKLLAEHCGVRNVMDLPPLTVDQILTWADEHKSATDDWPNRKSGKVSGTDETWVGIETTLSRGSRGLAGGSSLAKLLAEHRSVRNVQGLPSLTVEQILVWADAHKAASGGWPKQKSGEVTGTDETWARIQDALIAGQRGLPGGSSIAKLLAEHRSVRNIMDLPPLTIEQILTWIDAHKTERGDWPNQFSGHVKGTDETWAGINTALRKGRRALPGGSSLAKVLSEQRGLRNVMDLPPLTIEQILAWADVCKATTGDWPDVKSGQVIGTDETWLGIDATLRIGRRGLPEGTSLAKLLAEHRCVRNKMDLPPLTVEQILAWIDAHKAATGDWPNQKSGKVTDADETWLGIDATLRAGRRDLPRGSSLAKLLAEHRDVRNIHGLPPLTVKQILTWVDAYKTVTGAWPSSKSGKVTDADETWLGIDATLRAGRRGLPRGSSLAKLLAEHRALRNIKDLAPLTIQQILLRVDAHKSITGDWPNYRSGQLTGTDETWNAIQHSLLKGRRSLPGGSSLAKLLAEHRGVRNIKGLSPLTINQILAWADEHKVATSDWPRKHSGQVVGTDETWARINNALKQGQRGLPGGSSLAKLLDRRSEDCGTSRNESLTVKMDQKII